MISRSVTITASAQSLFDGMRLDASESKCKSIILQAASGNTGAIYFGDNSQQPMVLLAGGSASISCDTPKSLYVKGTANDVLNVLISDSDV